MDKETRDYFDKAFGRVHSRIDDLKDDIHARAVKAENRITKIEVKSGFWGLIGGALVTIPAIAIIFIKKLF